MAQTIFKRHEIKYKLTIEQYHELKQLLNIHMHADEYGKHVIHNIYFDTDDFLLIRNSIEKPNYKEKLRMRGYGSVKEHGNVFLEVKKKYNGIVYKRRISIPQDEALAFVVDHEPLKEETQITKEIDYFLHYYDHLSPSVLLSYEREAFYGKEDPNLRITFDQNILSRQEDIFNINEAYGDLVLPKDTIILEIKTNKGYPRWLLDYLGNQHIYKTSFSKYGQAYKQFILPKQSGGQENVI